MIKVPKFSARKCYLCGEFGVKKINLPKRRKHWCREGILISKESKICKSCNEKENLPVITKKRKISEMDCENIRKLSTPENFSPFSFEQLSEMNCRNMSSLSKENSRKMANICNLDPQNVFELLVILRQGLCQRFAGTLFNIEQSTISKRVSHTLERLSQVWVPTRLGSNAYSKEGIENNHIPPLFKYLFPNVIGVVDTTYFYIQKSEDFAVQKKTWSLYKNRNLVKELIVVLPDGTFYDIFGPFYANKIHGDDKIWNSVINSESMNIFEKGKSSFLVDRGFQRASQDFPLIAPESFPKGKKQLDRDAGNRTRLVTRLRNVVERAFGRLKQWKFLANIIDTNYTPKLHAIIRLIGAIINEFSVPLMAGNIEQVEQIEKVIDQRIHLEELNQEIICENTGWIQTNKLNLDFLPKYETDELEEFNLGGKYALNLAASYLNVNNDLIFRIHNKYPRTVRSSIKSRHSDQKRYKVILQFPSDNILDIKNLLFM